jgi:peptidoglycan/xylan/chitin deacetylase (PgdA/CDA1 family)
VHRSRALLKATVAFVQAQLLRWSGSKAGLALVYHRVEYESGSPGRELVPVIAAADFARQVTHLRRRYRVVPASELYPAVVARRRGRRLPVSITFDDDLRCHHTVALPLLRARNLKPTMFLCGASLDGPRSFWWERLQRYADEGRDPAAVLPEATPGARGLHGVAAVIEAMSPDARRRVDEELRRRLGPDPEDAGLRADDVAALAAAGIEIGFHTREHDRMPDLDDEALVRALHGGRGELARASGSPVSVLAYPHGRADPRIAGAARDAGYLHAFTTNGCAVVPSSDPLLLGRADPSLVPPEHFPLWVTRRLRELPGRSAEQA